MPAFKPTPSQEAAINTRGASILVSAGAGSGKTKVLTERLMAYITDPDTPAELDSFVIITFTRAAAGELRGRIAQELAERLALDPSNRRLRRQSALCQRAQIGTIHSFCGAVLRENCHLASLSPDFKIADEERCESMRRACLDRVLDDYYEHADAHPGFLGLVDTVGAGRDDAALAELVLTLHGKMQSHARPEKWAREQIALLNAGETELAKTLWGRTILERVAQSAAFWAQELENVLLRMAEHADILKAYGDSFSATAEAIRELSRRTSRGWDSARECLPIPFPRLGALRKSSAPEVSDYAKARRDACKKAMGQLDELLYDSSQKLLDEMAFTAPAMEALLTLTLDFDAAFIREKRRRSLVDYSDLEHLTARLLTDEDENPTPLAVELSRRYTEIMVDEYQDVSRVQDTIFRAISDGGRKLFMVGDVKQSIYRFRLADPAIFTEKYYGFADRDAAADGEPRRILLRENFRSRCEILNAANSVFSYCMSRSLGDIDYDDAAALQYGATTYEGEAPIPELCLIELPDADGDELSPDKTALEAAAVAREIRRMVAEGVPVTDHGVERPMEYGDAVILLRSANTVGPIYRRELARLGVPVASGQGGSFYGSVEISTVMSLLAVIDNPHQDIPLICVLRSAAFGFDADALSHIRSFDREHDFYTALCAAAREDERCRSFLTLLDGLRAEAPDTELADFIWRMYELCELPALCSAMSAGEERRSNLMLLFELARQFEAAGYRGLHRFVLWLRRMADKGQEPASGAETASAVRILSIHRSKGLEFPVVFLCDTARRFNRQDSRDTVLVHPELGLGPMLTDNDRRVKYPTLARNAIRLRLEREMLSEELRLLYVAMTRPKERLIVTAAVKAPQDFTEKCALAAVPTAPELLASCSCYAQWLTMAAVADGEEHLKIKIVPASKSEDEIPSENAPSVTADEDVMEKIARDLSFTYPYASACALPSKVTATELKSLREKDEDAQELFPAVSREFRKPSFAAHRLTGAGRGTATHLVMQYIDFAAATTEDGVRAEIERMRAARSLSDEDAAAVDVRAILGFVKGELGQRIRHADEVRREFKFSILCPAGGFFPEAGDEEILMQGVIDCFIVEDGRITVIDYKTDRVSTPEEVRARAELYTPQLRAYASALHRMTGREVAGCVLYFLHCGKEVYINTD